MRVSAFTVVILTAVLSLPTMSMARDEIQQATPGAGLTIYMDISAVGKTTRAAERMTTLHQQHKAKGWKVIDVDPYVEDGDLQGFFITYVAIE